MTETQHLQENQPTPQRSRKHKRKPGPRTYVLLALVLLLVLGGVAFAVLGNTGPVDADSTAGIAFHIEPGATAQEIAADLKAQNLIRSETAFRFYLRTHDAGGTLRAGDYLLRPSMDVAQIVDALQKGLGELVRVTIPEGFTLRDIADRFETEGVMPADTFWKLVRSYDVSGYPFLADCPDGDHRLEGFLFPDTYLFAKNTAPETVIRMMLDRFAEVYADLPANASGLDVYDTVKLASLVESEARFDDERATIASVYLNRLADGMLLQCDATVLYAMPERKTQLRFSDYKFESEYNTYLHEGLPPTPISNPGRASLEAAFQPAETNYYYYLWDRIDNDGHVFASTYEEHLENRRTYGY